MNNSETALLQKRFNIVKQWCQANGIVPQVSKIRVSLPLLAGVGDYSFDILNAAKHFVGEQTLNRNDVFIPFQWGVLLSFDSKDGATGKCALHTYAPKAGAQNPYGFMTDDIEALYNGNFTQTVDQTQIMQSYPAELFKFVPQNVPAVCLNSSDEEVSLGIVPEYSVKEGLPFVVPNIIYQGTMDIKTELHFNGTGSNFAVAAAATPTVASTDKAGYLNFIMYGVLVKNGADSARIDDLTNAYKEN